MAQRGAFIPASEKERIEELQTFVSSLQIRTHLFANSMSNYYPFTAYLPHDRQRVIDELQFVLDNRNESEMERFRSGLRSLGKEDSSSRPKTKKKGAEPMSL